MNAVPWKRVAVFVSSTFSDMHAERDYLVKRVFPDLSDWCERRRLRLVDVDLRWGVTETDATENRNVVQTCLARIDECRPFFLCFVGQRRGWVPMPDEIHPRTLDAFPDLRKHIGKASVTELEILHAILRPLHGNAPHYPARSPDAYRPADHAFFYLRDPSHLKGLPADPPERMAAYTNAGGSDPVRQARDDAELRRWREAEIPKCGRPVRHYTAQWNPDLSTPELALPLVSSAGSERGRQQWRERWAHAGLVVASDGLRVAREDQAQEFNRALTAGRLSDFRQDGDDLADVILDDLKRGIAARYPDHVADVSTPGSLQSELDQQEHFLFVNSEGFIERGDDFDELDAYVRGDSRKLFVLTAEGGMGKSMLLANWIDRCRADGSPLAETPFLFRFVGQSDGSTTAANVQGSILTELRDVYGRLPETVRVKEEREGPPGAASENVEREVPLEIPGQPNKLLEFWREWLPKASAQGKCVIVIDALNQLAEGLEHLHWLPQGELPEGLKFIVSFRRGAPGSERLLDLWREPYYADMVQCAEVRPFTEKTHRRALVDAYLDRYLKALDDHLIEELVSVAGAANPLYLKIVLSELRVFGSFEQLGQKIRNDFGADPVSAFRAVLRRLIADPAYAPLPSGQAVPVIFSALACARGGLSVEELSDILCRALGHAAPTEDQLRSARETALVTLRQERPFLARRDGRYDFFYESFQIAASESFVGHVVDKAHDKDAGQRQPMPCDPSARPATEWHSLIADHYAAQPNTNRRRLRELPHQLICAERWDDLIGDDAAAGPLTDLLFIQAKCEAGWVYELVKDYNSALAALPEFREENERLARRDAAMMDYNKALREYAVVRCDWWFARERGEHLPEPPYPAFPDELQDQGERPVPEESSQRAARVRQFANFVSGHLATLARLPMHTVTLACNWADGPVAKAADKLIEENRPPWIKRYPRPVAPPLRPQCIRAIEVKDGGSIGCVSMIPDNRRALSGSAGLLNTKGAFVIQLWDMESGGCLRIFEGHRGDVTDMDVCPDGRRAISCSYDKTLRLWDLETGACLRQYEGHSDVVTAVRVFPDGSSALSGSRDGTVRIWDLNAGNMCTLEGHAEWVESVSVSPDGRRAVSGSRDRTIRLWDLRTGTCLHVFEGHIRGVSCVSISPDGRHMISGSECYDNFLRLWDLETGVCLRTFVGHNEGVTGVSSSPDGRRVVSCSYDKTLRIWDMETGACLYTFDSLKAGVVGMSVCLDGRHVLTGGGACDNALRMWNMEVRVQQCYSERHGDEIECLNASLGSHRVASGSADRTIRLWDLNSGMHLRTMAGHGRGVRSIHCEHDDNRFISYDGNGSIRKWDMETGACLSATQRLMNNQGHELCVSPDGRRAVSNGWYDDPALRVWDLETLSVIRKLKGHRASIRGVTLSSDGRRAISGSGDGTIRCWDVEKASCLRTLSHHDADVRLVVMPDGQRVVTTHGHSIEVWDLASGKCLRTIAVHGKRVLWMSVSPDGRRALVATQEGSLQCWDLAAGACVRRLTGHGEGISRRVEFVLGGAHAISVGNDNTLRLWDVDSGQCPAIYYSSAFITSLAFSPSANRIICGTVDGQMHVLLPVGIAIFRTPIVTPIRLWLYGNDRERKYPTVVHVWRSLMARSHGYAENGSFASPGRWDDHITCRCAHCGKLFVPSEPVLEIGRAGARVIRRGLWLPDSDYEDPHLLSACPHCNGMLKFNPFVVDNAL